MFPVLIAGLDADSGFHRAGVRAIVEYIGKPIVPLLMEELRRDIATYNLYAVPVICAR